MTLVTGNLRPFRRGDFVTARLDEQEIDAMVCLASPNGRSLMLMFEGSLTGAHGTYLGMLPLFQLDDGRYVTLIGNETVQLTRREPVH